MHIDVTSWLGSLILAQYSKLFAANAIVRALPSDLTSDHLRRMSLRRSSQSQIGQKRLYPSLSMRQIIFLGIDRRGFGRKATTDVRTVIGGAAPAI